MENTQLLMSRSGASGIWGALGAYAALDVLFGIISVIPGYLSAKSLEQGDFAGALAGGGSACTALPLFLGGLLVSAARLGIVRTQREALFQGAVQRSPADVLKLGADRLGASLAAIAIFFVINFIGFCCCILPVFATLWATFMMPFLVAAAGMDLGQALSKSWELAQQHAAAIFGTIGIVTVLGLLSLVCGGMANAAGSTGVLIGGVLGTIIRSALFVAIWQLVGATQITIESVATNTPLAR
ncbi:MAG: hypothetical protein AAGH15_10910 [Myxococcota bacterium]